MKKNILKYIAVLSAAFVLNVLFTGCESSFAEKDVFTPADYSETEAVTNEINRIKELQEQNELKAFWRYNILLKEKNLEEENFLLVKKEFSEFENTLIEKLNGFVKDENYLEAYRYCVSLKEAGCCNDAVLSLDEEELFSEFCKNVPGLKQREEISSDQNEKANTFSDYIKGTVTILVDKGIKVENGMGYADGVIGSGFFISSDGYLITNHHVIADCVNPKYEGLSKLYIKLAEDSETRIPAKIIGWDSVLDLALLKVEVDAPYVFALGSSSDLEVGNKVLAIGSPLGLERTLTSGIVSATDRKLLTYGNVFQIDAAINSGNSGGPLIDEKGLVQGIIFAGALDFQGLNFAIPVEYLKYELPYLYAGGKRELPWICAFGKTKKMPGAGTKNEGLSIQYVLPGGSAGRSGVNEGETITSVLNKKIECLEDMQHFLLSQPSGMLCRMNVECGEGEDGVIESKEVLVFLDKRPASPGYEILQYDALKNAAVPLLGMKLENASTVSRKKFTVVSVLKNSVAEANGFSENDPVEILNIQYNEDKSAALFELAAKKRRAGYMDLNLGLVISLDSPYYF